MSIAKHDQYLGNPNLKKAFTKQRFTKKQVVSADPKLNSIVGFARTAKIRAASPPLLPPEKVQENRLAYYDYIGETDIPSIIAIEDTDYPNCIGAFWGELNVAIHKGLNLKGTLNLYQTAQKLNVKQFIFASSDWVYDGIKNSVVL